MRFPHGPGGRASRHARSASASASVLAVLAFTAVAAPAPALALEAIASRTPADITYWGPSDPRTTRQVVHTLALRAGPAGERLVVSTSSNAPITLSGPGRLLPYGGLSSARAQTPPPRGRDACPAQTTLLGASVLYRLDLPPGASSTLRYTDDLGLTRAPRDPASFAARWSLEEPAALLAVGPPALHVSEGPPRLLGLQGAAVTLRAGRTGSGQAIDDREAISVRSGTAMTLSGTLSYARRGERIVIWGYAPGARRPAPIGSARSDGHGRFLLRGWRPGRAGRWELYATYAGRPGLVEGTRSPCSGPRVIVAG